MKRFDPSRVAQLHCPIPQSQKSIKTSMEEMIDPKIEIKLVKSKQKYFSNLNTLGDQNQKAQGKNCKFQLQMKIK